MIEGKVLAMYDVRGIQNYVFRTSKMKDAIGASAIVENIILDALESATVQIKKKQPSLNVDLDWCTETEVLHYSDKDEADVKVLYIGGGNAYVKYKSENLAVEINKCMAKYIMERTYSLQLAVAMVSKTESYSEDYKNLNDKMVKVKAKMLDSKPIGAIPIVKVEKKTGYAIECSKNNQRNVSKETRLKEEKAEKVRREKRWKKADGILDNYILKKGKDSTIAIVHLDGNNMGLRIRHLMERIPSYEDAVNKMREISFHINSSYKKTFENMADFFNAQSAESSRLLEKENKNNFVMKVLVAGDDITYICNGKIALATVEYFSKKISKLTMTSGLNNEKEPDEVLKYGFSVCGGVAYIHSHFPFHVGYQVAEECCESAKKCAKKEEHKDYQQLGEQRIERIGNWVDFHVCKNVHAQNFERMRKKEYQTTEGDRLLMRPYFIDVDDSKLEKGVFKDLRERGYEFGHFKSAIQHFQDKKNMPRSFVKELRNTYPLGKGNLQLLKSFLDSRGHTLPEGKAEFYDEGKRALWYDALEMIDDYVDYSELIKEVGQDE